MATIVDRGTVCVLGGTGFIGRRLTNRLCLAGYNVRIPTRSRQQHRELLVLPSAELLDCDVHNQEVLSETLRGADAVVNLVGVLNDTSRGGKVFQRVHVDLVEKIVAACQTAGVKRLLHMSALKANAERGPSLYLRSKGQAEALIRAADSVDWTIFQPSVVFGPDDSFINRFAGLLRVSPVLPLAKPNARFAPVYVEDVVDAFCAALKDRATIGNCYQLGGPQIYSLREIVEFVARTIGEKRLILGLPDSLSKLQGWVFEHLPGRLFTYDNYLSLTVNSICSENGFTQLGLHPKAMEIIVPRYLARQDQRSHRDELRQSAGR